LRHLPHHPGAKGYHMRKAWMLRAWLVVMLLGSAGFETSVWAQSWPNLVLKPFVSGLNAPIFVTHAGDGSGRVFLVEQAGRVRIFKNGAVLPTLFLDITSKVAGIIDGGLMCLAFPPDFTVKKYFYAYYTNLSGNPVLSRFHLSTTNPDLADAATEEQLLTFTASVPSMHQGGFIGFHPISHYLYVSTGDTGPQEDPNNNSQNPGILNGKILRLDVEHGPSINKPYRIPPSNPFVNNSNYLPEIWALGLRNPFRCSFAPNGDFYIADVGYNTYEEIDFEGTSSTGGANYGWNILEGPMITGFNGSVPPPNYVGPIASFIHPTMEAIIGGYVYRGSQYPRMQGIYFFADFGEPGSGEGQIWGMRTDTRETKALLSTNFQPCSFGEDEAGNLYVVDITNAIIYQIVDTQALTGIYELLLLD
jgi:glucose/arabinose dehydrogenase